MRISGKRLSFGFDRFSGLYLWALFILIFGIWEPHLFLSLSTVHSIASEQSVAALLGLAVVVPLATGAFDLSIGATANLSAVVVAILQSQQHWSMWPAIAVALLIGVLIGTVNGFIIVRLHVNAFIATLGMATIVGAVETIVSGNSQPQPPTSSAWAVSRRYWTWPRPRSTPTTRRGARSRTTAGSSSQLRRPGSAPPPARSSGRPRGPASTPMRSSPRGCRWTLAPSGACATRAPSAERAGA